MNKVGYQVSARLIFLLIISVGAPSPGKTHGLDNPRLITSEAELLQQQDRQIRLIIFFGLVPIVASFAFLAFIFYRRKREEYFRRTEAELQLSKAEVEMKALKAQINPHFIFNCMNSIHHYMHKNDVQKASDYLIKFSKLIRMVLENSSLKNVTLREELQTLELYIQLEQFRLDGRFHYAIEVAADLDQNQCEIPGFLIQPFVENAIWHELDKMSRDAMLKITIRPDATTSGIFCDIYTDGKGKTASPNAPTSLTDGIKKTSMGLNLIRERLALLNRSAEKKAYFIVNALSEPDQNRYGHHIELYIPTFTD